MKSLKAFFAFALVLGIAAPAYAETQNVKVSGSIDMYGIARDGYDLNGDNDFGAIPITGDAGAGNLAHHSETDNYFMSITQIGIQADLTDNVSTVINLINQRDWNADVFGSNGTANTTQEFDVELDLAYVQMKEIFYAPLTLTIGRQDLVFGRGFIVGWNPQDPSGTIQADEFTQIQSFDAIRATLDFAPWTLDFFASKVNENNHDPEDDRDLYGANVNYKFAEYNAVAEGYLFSEVDAQALVTAPVGATATNSTHTLGGRVQFDPISQITLGGELAYQFGEYQTTVAGPERDRGAWGLDIFGEYRFEDPWKTMVGLEYVHLSGEENLSTSGGDYGSWNGNWRLPVYGWIRDYQEVIYATAQTTDQAAGQNQNHISIYGSINPMEDLKLTGNFFYFWTDEDVHVIPASLASPTLSDSIGWEVDTAAIYAYTEDVTFTFMANVFVPGDYFAAPNDDTASEFISEVKVTF